MNPYQHTERPVLVPSNNNPPQLYNYLSSDKKKPNSQYEARQNLVKIYDNKET